MARYALKKHVAGDFVTIETFEGDGSTHTDVIALAKTIDPHGGYVIEAIHTTQSIVNTKPKRKAKGDS